MACERLKWQLRSLVQLTARARPRPSSPSTSNTPLPRRSPTSQTRRVSGTAQRWGLLSSYTEAYRVIAASERVFKVCSKPADYAISDKVRKEDGVKKLEDGEELGVPLTPLNVWHSTFKLPPSFNTWSHVTMLHLYLINAQLRCFENDAYRSWQQQLIDHFFFECEKKMHLDHNITSSALRQRYLKDVFVQWRGLLLAYDEGLIRGDAILASAVWRNLFKGSPDVEPMALLAVVGWMRASLVALEGVSEQSLAQDVQGILTKHVASFATELMKAKEKLRPIEERCIYIPKS
ncbi:ubiquinol-cytochrome C chaperone [Ophiocordyceps camponoti-floridani]|uniref:Ubiquinol-cytochrome C chaperone n=1 Tax=Ophiocordyceps camponoti-floridani TaxID=2030778 RepID=A0A8H4Q7C0_9HYPO|nr:ubiquinol-cytochrome C chaperone [Ophiocordyceps camponoti-floridani]